MTLTTNPAAALTFEDVTLDAYSNIHKCVRSVLFSTAIEIGAADAANLAARRQVGARVAAASALLASHAKHEDVHVQPAIVRELPGLAGRITDDHARFDLQTEWLQELAAAAALTADRPRRALHKLYVEFNAFTSAYLDHQDYEERVVMPAMEQAIGVPAVVAIHEAIVSSIPPQEMAETLAIMLPVINIDERVEMLDGIRMGAPAEAFAGVCALAASVLSKADYTQLSSRLGLA